MSLEPGVVSSKQRPAGSVLEEGESCCIHGGMKEVLNPQNGSPAEVTHLPQAQEAPCHKQKGAAGEWIRSHPVLTLAVLTLLLLLVVALAVSLAAVSERSCADVPVIAVTPDTPLLLACPDGWVGYRGICYLLSRDHLAWDQAKDRCFELGASLAVVEDWEMEFLFHLSGNDKYWLGLHRQGQRLQWVDGSNFSSSVPVRGNADCVHLAENYLGSAICSNEMQYVCSRPQTPL